MLGNEGRCGMTYRRAVRSDQPHDDDLVPAHAGQEEVIEETYASTEAADRIGTTRTYDSLPARVTAILTALLLGLESLLALRFALLAFGASTTSGFVNFILDVSWPFVRPFSGAFANRTWEEGIVEINTLLAMGVWLLAFALIGLVLNAILPNVSSSETRVRRSRVEHL
jgi:hypothetical protein